MRRIRTKTTGLTSVVSTLGDQVRELEVLPLKTNRGLLVVCVAVAPVWALGCASNTASTPPTGAAHPVAVAVKPDAARARAHLDEHVTYPAARSQVLDACASTKEFSDAEKRWFSDNLPEGQYASAREVVIALKLDAGCSEPAAVTCKD
jgi:hypothetical protein